MENVDALETLGVVISRDGTVYLWNITGEVCMYLSEDVDQNLHRRSNGFAIEDGVKFIIDCPTYSEIRQELVSGDAKGVSSAQIFVSIFKSSNKATLLNLGQFITKALSTRR